MSRLATFVLSWWIVVAASASVAQASADVWDANGLVPPSGIWGTAVNWADNTTPGNSDTATFNLAAAYTVTFNANPLAIQALTVTGTVANFTSSGGARTLLVNSAVGGGGQDVTINGGSNLSLGTSGNPLHLTVGDDLTINGGSLLSANFGSQVNTLDLFLATTNGGGNGVIVVDGTGSQLNVTNGFNLAQNGNTGTLTYRNAAQGTLGGTVNLAPSSNPATVATLNVESNADLNTASLAVGNGGGAGTGTLNINGTGSTLIQSGASTLSVGTAAACFGNINIGTTATGGTLTTGSGAITINARGAVTIGAGANTGTLNANGNVTVNGGTLTRGNGGSISGSLFNLAAGKSMTIQNGGTANFTGSYHIDNGTSYVVTGAGSTWSMINGGFNGALFVGGTGTSTLSIENGGQVSSDDSTQIQVNGSVTVTGAGSTLNVDDNLAVGPSGFGTSTLSIESGGQISSSSSTIAGGSGNVGSATVTGAGSAWITSGLLEVGKGWTGSLTVSAGGHVASGSSVFGSFADSDGTVTVTGAGSTWNNGALMVIGDVETGTIMISNGGQVSTADSILGRSMSGDLTPSHGAVTVTGAGSTWNNSALLVVGKAGIGTLMISNGGAVSSAVGQLGTGGIGIGDGAVTVTGAGSTWTNSGSLYLGGDSASAMGSGLLTVETGGTVNVGAQLVLWTDGKVELNGGQINLAALVVSGDTFDFNFGTLNFTTSQTIAADGPIEKALGGERRVGAGQHLGIEGVATLNAPFHIDGGGLEVNSLMVNSAFQFTAGLLEVRGGAITGLTNLVVPASGEFRVRGVYTLAITGVTGSTITATGNLTLGDATKANGVYSNGNVQVGANTVTLADANDVVLDSAAFVTLGNGASPGTLAAANGLTLDFGGNVAGFGTVNTPNSEAKPLINNGHIAGNSGAQPITLSGYVKGVGTLDNVVITGTDAPGFSPATVVRGSVVYDGNLEIEIGGTAAGSFDRIHHLLGAGVAALGGELDVELTGGFNPVLSDMFEIITAFGGVSGRFDALAGPLPTLSPGLEWVINYGANNVVLQVVALVPTGDYNRNGTVDAADYTVWRNLLGQIGFGLAADGNHDNRIDRLDFDVWKSNFGSHNGSGSALNAAVPEPNILVMLAATSLAIISRRRRTAT